MIKLAKSTKNSITLNDKAVNKNQIQKKIRFFEKMGRASKTAKEIFDYLEKNPIIDIKKTSKELTLAFSTVSASVKRLEKAGILLQTNNASRNRVFAYEAYLEILRKDT